jgi:hypothetical protein
MKKKKIDFDFIGGQGSLTKEEEKLLSDYFKNKKVAKGQNSKAIAGMPIGV